MSKFEKIKASLIAQLRFDETLIEVAPDDIVEVSRNTKGNLLPATTQEMTLKEALAYGAWSTESGTMEATVRLSPNVYENPVNIYVKNGFAYGVERDESKS